MLKALANLPISRRLFVAFALAALLPTVVSGIIGFYFVNQGGAHAGIVTLTIEAQGQANTIANDLTTLDNQQDSLRAILFGGFSNGSSPTRAGVPANIDTQVKQINQQVAALTQELNAYNSKYNPLSPNMQVVQTAVNQSRPEDTTMTTESNTLGQILSTAWPDCQAKLQTQLSFFQQSITRINAFINASSNPNDNKNFFTQMNAFRTQFGKNTQALDASQATLKKDWNDVSNDVGKISSIANLAEGNTRSVLLSSIGIYLAISVLIIFVGYTVHKSIANPLTELVSLTKRISKGDTNARVSIAGHDEISIVATAMNSMLDNIVRLIQETQLQRDGLQGQVEKLVSEVSGVGEGDLRVQAEVTADALGVLADSFNYMVEELGSLVVRVKSVARDVEESTTMTSDRMSELVETADRQIQQIGNAALEIERMAVNSQQVVNRSTNLANSAREARLSAQGGRQAVLQTIEGMGRISLNVQETSQKVQSLGESSREINNIMEVISTIAHQTNRLALDAAIQAAMAGENGKGFGAVAADIRRLAERAKEQATSVGRIVRTVRDEISAVAVSMLDTERETATGARLAEEAGTSLESIFSVVERQGREIDVINQMAMQQQQSSNNVVQTMQGISESTQESSGSTREAAKNMERIARLAEQLRASVEAFKLRESLNYLAPNAAKKSEEDGVLTLSGAFRTVTATAQPVSNASNSFAGLPAPDAGNGFAQFSPAFFTPGNQQSQPAFAASQFQPSHQFFAADGQEFQSLNNGQQPFAGSGFGNGQQQPFPSQGFGNGQQSFSTQGFGNGQQPFSAQGFGNGPQPFPSQGLNNGQQPFATPGFGNDQQAFPSQGPWNGQQFSFPPQGPNNGQPLSPLPASGPAQRPFAPQGSKGPGEPQWPDPSKDWQSSYR